MNSMSSRMNRLVDALPVLAALAFHAIALDRWALAAVATLVLGLAVARDVSVSASTRLWYVAGGIGLLAGMVMPVANILPSALLPPVVWGALTGMLVGVAVFAVLSGKVSAAWGSAWMLVATSGQVAMSPMLSVSLSVFVFVSLLAAVYRGGVFQARSRAVLPLVLFAVTAILGTSGIAAGLNGLEGAFLKTMESLFNLDAESKTTGIGREISINSRSSIRLSKRPLLELSAEPGFLRAHVMDQFDGRQWRASSQLRSVTHTLSEVPIRGASVRNIEMMPLDDLGGALPSPAGTWEVRGATPQVQGGWILRGEADAASLTLVGDALERLPKEELMAEYVMVPGDLSEQLRPIAERLTEGAVSDREKIERIEAFFHEHFEYSLKTDLSGQEHPLVMLVKERRPAYCIYFASAMAVMLRTQDIPTRVVSGFVPTEVNPITQRVTVRQRDAHAWVEAWLAAEGRFVAFDPTPASSREKVIGQSGSPGFFSAVFGAAASVGRRTWTWLKRDPLGSLAEVAKSPIAWIVLGGVLVAYLLRWRRKHAASPTRESRIESSDPLLRQIHGRYVRSLQIAGIDPQPWETEDELIFRLEDTADPAIAVKAKQFMGQYRRARFCGDVIDRELLQMAELGLPQD